MNIDATRALLLAGVLLCAPALAADPPPPAEAKPPAAAAVAAPAPVPAPGTVAIEAKCSSVVIRNCRARFVPDPVPDGSAPAKSAEVPGRWEAVRVVDADSEEILVEEERLRDPAVRDVFDRYLRTPPAAYATRNAAGGARCTTIVSTGAKFCSRPGAGTPDTGLPHADFSDGAF
jgi:hypothetical protein